jgi:hypothetical protein
MGACNSDLACLRRPAELAFSVLTIKLLKVPLLLLYDVKLAVKFIVAALGVVKVKNLIFLFPICLRTRHFHAALHT